MTVVIGTAGHIDHGKTSLLLALTGIDADRLPEERRRGMTIDVGYAWLALADGEALDFVDVPGHDKLVGNMLVGAGEIDAAMLVVAADEGPRAQTLEHLGLLDALGIREGLAVLTKLDLLPPEDPRRRSRPAELGALLEGSSLAGSPVLAVSALSGEGISELRLVLDRLRRRLEARARTPAARRTGGVRLAVDRVFTVRGRGVVVTGTLRGGRLERGEAVRLEPGGHAARVRELQVHGHPVEAVAGSGRVALNLAGVERDDVVRGMVVATGPAVVASDQLLVQLRPTPGSRPLVDGAELRLHLGTDEVLGHVRVAAERSDRGAERPATDRSDPAPGSAAGPAQVPARLAALRLARPIAAALDDPFVLRWPSPAGTAAGGRVLDPLPPPRFRRRRLDADALTPLAEAGPPAHRLAALVAAHGALPRERLAAYATMLPGAPSAAPAGSRGGSDDASPPVVSAGIVPAGPLLLSAEVAEALQKTTHGAVAAWHAAHPLEEGMPLSEVRPVLARALRRRAVVQAREAAEAIAAVIDGLVANGRLTRSGGLLRDPAFRPSLSPHLAAAMQRLEVALRTPAPPPLGDAARAAGCPPDGVRLLETSGRIVRVAPDLAYAAPAYRELEALALRLASAGPIAPAAFRDASGTSRKYALAILEEMGTRGLLRRGPEGHRLGPNAPRA